MPSLASLTVVKLASERNKMKGGNTLKILEGLKEISLNMTDLMMAFLKSPYGASISRMDYELNKLQKERRISEEKIKIERQLKQRFYNMLYKLEMNGLIEKTKKDNNIFFGLTLNGMKRLKILKKRKKNVLPELSYKSLENNNFVIVIFDIPESERRKRGWLRSALKNLGFDLIQKSVWMGKVKIPKEFLRDLKELKIVNFVEIFEISKGGTLRQIT